MITLLVILGLFILTMVGIGVGLIMLPLFPIVLVIGMLILIDVLVIKLIFRKKK